MTKNSKIKLDETLFKAILQIEDHSKLQLFLKEKKLPVTVNFNVMSNLVEGISFDDRFLFDFNELEIENLKANLDIHNDAYFYNIKIIGNDSNILIRLKDVKAEKILLENNENLDIELIGGRFTEITYTKNFNSRRLCLLNSEVEEDLEINESDLEYLYIENSICDELKIKNTKILLEGIVLKSTKLDKFLIWQLSSIYKINTSDNTTIHSLDINNCIVRYINIDETDIKFIQFSSIKRLDELTFYKNSEIGSLNIYLSSINRLLINEDTKISEIVIQKDSFINLCRATDNCNISWITIKKSNILFFVFHRGISIKYFESDGESNIGDFDILECTIKSLTLTNQTNSYNFQNTDIGLLKLDDCKISYLNILNGCKIEAYISNCDIDKVDFKQIIILKDTLISFSSCRIYSLIMENFSVIGGLYFRELIPLKTPLNEEWSNINKYAFNNVFFEDQIKQKYENIKSVVLKSLNGKDKGWINENTNNNSNNLMELLIKQDYISSKISNDKIESLINNLKNAYLSYKQWYEERLLRMIDEHTYLNIKALRKLTNIDRENLEFNKNILQFIWEAISKMHSYNLLFQNINKPLFRVYQSSLGKTEFSNCSLKDFEFQYNSTNFYDCLFLGTDIPEDNLKILDSKITVFPIENTEIKSKIEFHKQKSEFFSQFKKIFEKQGNVFQAGLFNSKWAENQEKLLLLNIGKNENYLDSSTSLGSFLKSVILFFEESNISSKQDVFTFNLNRISNNHGESWLRSIGFILVPLSILYFFFILSLYYDFITPYDVCDKKVKFVYDNNLFTLLRYHSKDFFSFLNPARRLEQIKPLKNIGHLNFVSSLIDFTARIILAFGIYQLIVAFRKNAKKQ
ncbi:hypothetical protein SAMN05443633_103409 [Chryseobacterium arachidis]|uniref:Pentapeptide repeat-containing protein n=2 Tax=Chryseobacterium arachidis TaxID=1416778 RepID=A0A1M5A9B8_9FLAO|nr:hypothetical protein [Chryseobacterium arachidis]SHF26636.1 hypothetical protein SAMN05443633_103409 [Chryseobacterium arachidis]